MEKTFSTAALSLPYEFVPGIENSWNAYMVVSRILRELVYRLQDKWSQQWRRPYQQSLGASSPYAFWSQQKFQLSFSFVKQKSSWFLTKSGTFWWRLLDSNQWPPACEDPSGHQSPAIGRFLRAFRSRCVFTRDLFPSWATLPPRGLGQCTVCSADRTLPSPCRCLLPTGTGSVFHASDCLDCTVKAKIKQIFSAPSTVQKMGDCRRKDVFHFRRLRKLKKIFSCFLNLIWYNLSTQSRYGRGGHDVKYSSMPWKG